MFVSLPFNQHSQLSHKRLRADYEVSALSWDVGLWSFLHSRKPATRLRPEGSFSTSGVARFISCEWWLESSCHQEFRRESPRITKYEQKIIETRDSTDAFLGVCVCAECRQSRLAAAQLAAQSPLLGWRAACTTGWLSFLATTTATTATTGILMKNVRLRSQKKCAGQLES